MNETQTYRPTGKLNEDGTMMEVRLVGIAPVPGPTLWVSVTPEMKAKILEQNNSVVSMSAVVATPEMRERIRDMNTPGDWNSLADAVIAVLPSERAKAEPKTLAEAAGMETTPEEEEEWTRVREHEDRAFLAGMATLLDKDSTYETTLSKPDESKSEDVAVEAEHSGFNVNYYSVEIKHPKRPDREPYIFEVEDLIQALNLGFHEGTVLKSLVRSANEREHGRAKLGGDAVRDAEKMVHSSSEHLRALKIKAGK